MKIRLFIWIERLCKVMLKKILWVLGIVYVFNMIFNVYYFGFCLIVIFIFDILIEDRKIIYFVIFYLCSFNNI